MPPASHQQSFQEAVDAIERCAEKQHQSVEEIFFVLAKHIAESREARLSLAMKAYDADTTADEWSRLSAETFERDSRDSTQD